MPGVDKRLGLSLSFNQRLVALFEPRNDPPPEECKHGGCRRIKNRVNWKYAVRFATTCTSRHGCLRNILIAGKVAKTAVLSYTHRGIYIPLQARVFRHSHVPAANLNSIILVPRKSQIQIIGWKVRKKRKESINLRRGQWQLKGLCFVSYLDMVVTVGVDVSIRALLFDSYTEKADVESIIGIFGGLLFSLSLWQSAIHYSPCLDPLWLRNTTPLRYIDEPSVLYWNWMLVYGYYSKWLKNSSSQSCTRSEIGT